MKDLNIGRIFAIAAIATTLIFGCRNNGSDMDGRNNENGTEQGGSGGGYNNGTYQGGGGTQSDTGSMDNNRDFEKPGGGSETDTSELNPPQR
jgi:hypothetical protein